ncbi:MAG TPA: hypothetical protein VKD28_05705, partial [Gemmatimonadales bacterium]|nr:hypothetical protein [Gemmatimonadales bacterium]
MAVAILPKSLNVSRVATAMRGTLPIALLFSLVTCRTDKTGGPTTTQLFFRAQPQHTMAGSAFAPVRVVVRDDKGKDVTDFSDLITLSIGANPGGGVLGGTTTMRAIAGVATFADLTINKAGSGYRLMATAGSLAPATSTPFDITSAPATHLVITVEPTTSTAGSNIGPAIRVAARDAFENNADGFTGDITVTMAPGTGSPGATLSGTTTVAATAGVAVFSALSIDKTGTGYRLSVTATNLSATTSDAFDITPGSASQLVVTQQPTTITAGDPINPAVVVVARDAWGNDVPAFAGNVTLDLTAGTGSPGASLLGTSIVAAVGGTATFTTLSVNRTGTAYTLSARASGLVTATTAPFDVTPGPVSQLVFVSPPINTTAGVVIPSVQIAAQDSLGNTVEDFAGAVTIAIGANPSAGTLSGTSTVTAVGGIATFATLSIDKSGTGYRLVASSGSLSRTCDAFSIMAGAATILLFTTQPTSVMARATISPSVRVVARDALGNTADGFSGDITLAITAGTGTAGAALFGTTTVAA